MAHDVARKSLGDAAFAIVGTGACGHAAATAYRAAGGTGRVVLISDEAALPYQRPPLSKAYLRGELQEDAAATELPLMSARELDEAGLEVLLEHRVTRLDPEQRTLTTADGAVLHYDRCLLATGAAPVAPPVPGGDHPGIHLLRTLADARRLREAAEQLGPDGHVVVIGSGFIGCEAAASLARRGLRVTLVSSEPAPQYGRLGPFAADRLSDWLAADGVRLVLEAPVRALTPVGSRLSVELDGGALDADLVLAATGIRPRAELAQRAGLETAGGRIVTDERMWTSAPDVLAAGDVAAAEHVAAGRQIAVEHWGDALAMGRVAGTVAAGGEADWDEVPGFWSTIGDRTLKYVAWGDGHDDEQVVVHEDGGFTVRYGRDGVLVGVLTHDADLDHEAARTDIAAGKPF